MTDRITSRARRAIRDFGDDENCHTCGSYNENNECEAIPGCGDDGVSLWTPATDFPGLGDFDPDEDD
jgi:hypothetical protein